MGWRLPTVEEFTSLADASGPGPVLPAGHPFAFINWDYWTATTLDGSKGFWCIRGGQGFDGSGSP